MEAVQILSNFEDVEDAVSDGLFLIKDSSAAVSSVLINHLFPTSPSRLEKHDQIFKLSSQKYAGGLLSQSEPHWGDIPARC